MQEERSIKDLMNSMFDNYQMSDKLHETKLLAGWEELMGKTIAKNTKRLYIRNKVLHLILDSPALKNDMVFYEKTIVEKVNQFAKLELITSIKVR